MIECICDLLKYDPDVRLTSLQCLEHPYLLETLPLNNPPGPPPPSAVSQPPSAKSTLRNGIALGAVLNSISPRHLPPSHAHTSVNDKPAFQPSAPVATAHIPDASSSHRTSFYDSSSAARALAISETSSKISDYGSDLYNSAYRPDGVPHVTDGQSSAYGSSVYSVSGDRVTQSLYASSGQPDWDMDISPQGEGLPDHYMVSANQTTEIQTSPMAREYPHRPVESERIQDHPHTHEVSQPHGPKLGKFGPFGLGKKSSKWGLSMFGHGDKGSQPLPPVQEVNIASAGSTPSLKRTQSSSTDSRSLSDMSPLQEAPLPPVMDAKMRKKEAERIAREAEKQRRQLAQKMHRDQARAVMEKQKRLLNDEAISGQYNWQYLSAHSAMMGAPPPPIRENGKQPVATGSIRQTQSYGTASKTVKAAGGIFNLGESSRSDSQRVAKARRREFDDDHSMSSSDIHSVISFATVDSDPGPTRARYRPGAYGGLGRTSMNSLRTSVDEYSLRSSGSLPLEQQFGNDLHLRASVDTSSLSDGGSPPPPPMHMLSLSSPTWQQQQERSSNPSLLDSGSMASRRQGRGPELMTLSIPPQPRHPHHLGGHAYGPPPSPGMAPKSAINPIFKVVSRVDWLEFSD